MPESPSENDDRLFAEHAVKAGFLTEEEVEESLRVQQRMAEMGVEETLRNVLVKRGALREGDAAVVARKAGLRSTREPIPGYTLQSRLGSGAMGSVYRAHQRGMKRDVAVKILRRDLTDDPRQIERLQREAALVGKLDHPNIVRGLDSGETAGLVWFVMELVDGETLHARIRRAGPLPPDAAISIARQVAEALTHAHSHGVVHRDIKPGNILLTKDGLPRLSDYGLAKGESDDALTQLDATLGTPQYIAPEQARNPRDADIRSDIYSLGATLYAMLTGHPPFQGETLAQTLTKVLYERPKPLAEAAPGTSREVAYVVQRMMAKDRRYRYVTPQEVVRDLRALEGGRLHVPQSYKGDIAQFVETRRQRRVWLTGAAIVAGALLVAAGSLWWKDTTEQRDLENRSRNALQELLVRPGDPSTWEERTVEEMIPLLEAHRAEFPDTEAAGDALTHLEAWRKQESGLLRVGDLRLRVDGMTDPQWPELFRDLREEQRALEAAGDDAAIARRRLVTFIGEVAERRDKRARESFEAAGAEAARLPLLDAAAGYETLARRLRKRYYGAGPAPLASDAERLARGFRRAQTLLDEHFGPVEAQLREGELLRKGEFLQLEKDLWEAMFAAESPGELVELLNSLPPERTRQDQVNARLTSGLEALRAACSRRWQDLDREVDRLLADRAYDRAEQLLGDFAARALARQKSAALARISEVGDLRETDAREISEATAQATQEFFSALGRREYGAARDALDLLAARSAGRVEAGAPSALLVDGGRRLLDLIERLAWDALRDRLRRPESLDRGLQLTSGIRYQNVSGVKVDGRHLEFSHGSDHRWKGQISDVSLEDVVHYGNLPGASAGGALVFVALHLAEYRSDPNPAKSIDRLTALAPHLERAATDPDLQAMAARLSQRRLDLVRAATDKITAAEVEAKQHHRDAQRALAEGRYEEAWTKLDSLLRVGLLNRTDYVNSRRDEIERERDRASRGRQTSRYAEHLPGMRLMERSGGMAELIVDFDHPEATEALDLATDRVSIISRPRVLVERPAPSGATPQDVLVDDRRVSWHPWDGDPDHHPRLFPLVVRNPFQMRRRIEVSFLYESDAPFFLAVSIGGSTAGVLSAPDVRAGGRGVKIWHATDLDRPDEAFGERHRTTYLEKHPEVLRKEGDTTFFHFLPGRAYRVRFVKAERRASLYVDGRKLAEEDVYSAPSPELRGKLVIATYTGGEVDDLRISGILDPDWLRNRE